MYDGQRFTNPAYVEPGWVLMIPAGTCATAIAAHRRSFNRQQAGEVLVATSYVVEQGDTLWDIADERTRCPAPRGRRSGRTNAGDDMGDGRTFDDPNLILPGWELELPDDRRVADRSRRRSTRRRPSTLPSANRRLASRRSSLDRPPTTPRHRRPPPRDTDTGALADDRCHADTRAAASRPGRHAADDVAARAPRHRRRPSRRRRRIRRRRPPERGVAPDAPSPIRIEHAAMLAAGILALVGVRRRQRLRAARPRSRVPEPRPDVVETELLLRRIDAGERAHPDRRRLPLRRVRADRHRRADRRGPGVGRGRRRAHAVRAAAPRPGPWAVRRTRCGRSPPGSRSSC